MSFLRLLSRVRIVEAAATASSWLALMSAIALTGLILADGFFLSIPFSIAAAIAVRAGVLEAAYVVLALGLIACYGLAKLYPPPPPREIPRWAWILLAMTGFLLGLAVGAGAVIGVFIPLIMPYLAISVTEIIMSYFVVLIVLLLMIVGFILAGGYFATTIPLAIMFLCILFVVGWVIFTVYTAFVSIITLLANTGVSLALGLFGNRRGIGVGVGTIIKALAIPFEILFFTASVSMLFILAHVLMMASSVFGSLVWMIQLPHFYLYIAPAFGVTAAGTSAMAMFRTVMSWVGQRVNSLLRNIISAEAPWLTALLVVYLMSIFAYASFLAYLLVQSLVGLLTVLIAATLTTVTISKRVRTRNVAAFATAITCLMLLLPLTRLL